MVCSDGLTDAIEQVWPHVVHQQCVVHLVRASLRYTNRKDWQRITPRCGRSTPPRPSLRPRHASRPAPPIPDVIRYFDTISYKMQAEFQPPSLADNSQQSSATSRLCQRPPYQRTLNRPDPHEDPNPFK
jgi:hypothetical protein